MLFGFTKSKKEKAQEEYKNFLYELINLMKNNINTLENKPNDRDALIELAKLRNTKDLDKFLDDLISDFEFKATRNHRACYVCDDAKTPENIYLSNELKELTLKFIRENKNIEIPEDIRSWVNV